MTAEQRLLALRRMVGFIENGTSSVLKISQDDATRTWFLRVDNRLWHAETFLGVIDIAARDFQEESN